MKIYWTKINQIVDETPEVKTNMLDRPEDFTWEEGAHTHLGMKGFNAGNQPNRMLLRHMTSIALPHEDLICITTRISEQCSEYKQIVRNLDVGSEVAIFKAHSNIPLQRKNKNIYMLSQGVGLATFRPLVLDYFMRPNNVNQIHSLNIDSLSYFYITNYFSFIY